MNLTLFLFYKELKGDMLVWLWLNYHWHYDRQVTLELKKNGNGYKPSMRTKEFLKKFGRRRGISKGTKTSWSSCSHPEGRGTGWTPGSGSCSRYRKRWTGLRSPASAPGTGRCWRSLGNPGPTPGPGSAWNTGDTRKENKFHTTDTIRISYIWHNQDIIQLTQSGYHTSDTIRISYNWHNRDIIQLTQSGYHTTDTIRISYNWHNQDIIQLTQSGYHTTDTIRISIQLTQSGYHTTVTRWMSENVSF